MIDGMSGDISAELETAHQLIKAMADHEYGFSIKDDGRIFSAEGTELELTPEQERLFRQLVPVPPPWEPNTEWAADDGIPRPADVIAEQARARSVKQYEAAQAAQAAQAARRAGERGQLHVLGQGS